MNSSKTILVVFGTRPEAIKMAPVINELKKSFKVKICVTAQHREMLDQALKLFNIKPDFDLNIMKPSQDLFDITINIMQGIKKILLSEDFKMVLVHGDTTTSMVTAMAAFNLKIPVGHVEAGLRTYNIYSPFPEELNRQIISRIASYHFAPTEMARQNLLKEYVKDEKIYVTGNTIIDSLLSVVEKARKTEYPNKVLESLPFFKKKSNSLPRILLITGHRRENFGKGFENICQALLDIALLYPDIKIIYPVHLNPNLRVPVNRILSDINNIFLIEPLDYLTFIKLMDSSYLVITDSGGIQEEGPSLGKPVLVTREATERPEAIKAGTVIIVGTNRRKILKTTCKLLDDRIVYKKMSKVHNPYGDGNASKRISNILKGDL
jgi:UDP-N-acetylglucosamine 2-epimerase (non-hydrolysing)